MKFINKNIKVIIGVIVCLIVTNGITVYGAYKYFATDVIYTKNRTEMKVSEALNDLYGNKKDVSELNTLKTNINQTNAKPGDILNGKKAYTQNGLITGTYKKDVDEIINRNDNDNYIVPKAYSKIYVVIGRKYQPEFKRNNQLITPIFIQDNNGIRDIFIAVYCLENVASGENWNIKGLWYGLCYK